MNQDDFRDLVRSKIRTTKQIAREAVEEAFQKKKRKRKGRGRRDDDDYSSSESESEKPRKKALSLQPTSIRNTKQDGTTGSGKYRDRALERREGKIVDDSEQPIEEDPEGDGAAQRKGLDVALARSVKNQLKEGRDSDEESGNEDMQNPVIETKEEALEFLQSYQTSNPLGRSIKTLLLAKQKRSNTADTISVSAAGSIIQRSQWTFAVDWHPQNLALSWEIPIEKSVAAAAVSLAGTALPKACPLSSDLVEEIKAAHKQQFILVDTFPTKKQGKVDKGTAPAETQESEDSDDDIFPEAGD